MTETQIGSREKHSKKAVVGKKKQANNWSVCRWLLSRCHGGRHYRWRRQHPRGLHGCCSRESGNFLTTLYCLVKCLYVVNAVGQIYLMERFVGARVTFYGAAVLADLVRGRDWQQSGHFPRVTFCDMEAKKLGKNHPTRGRNRAPDLVLPTPKPIATTMRRIQTLRHLSLAKDDLVLGDC
ncbi:Innexin unc-9 [Taenia solium]|eukprot:TsM_001009600 transcript=TsM_001009600 gene=TsM_001009600